MKRLYTLLVIAAFSAMNMKGTQHPVAWTATYYGNTYKTPRKTANGEQFNMYALTCAAPKRFRFGTILKVTNTANGKSVIVRVTDRGAFGERNIDLSYGAFGKIAEHRTGRIKVKVEEIKKEL